MIKSCLSCKRKYWVDRKKGKMCCSPQCVSKYKNSSPNKLSNRISVSTTTIGAMSELCVAQYLMRHCFEVFKAMSPASYSDIVAIKNDEIYKVEVKTGYFSASGVLHHGKKNLDGKELVIVVYPENDDIPQIIFSTDRLRKAI